MKESKNDLRPISRPSSSTTLFDGRLSDMSPINASGPRLRIGVEILGGEHHEKTVATHTRERIIGEFCQVEVDRELPAGLETVGPQV